TGKQELIIPEGCRFKPARGRGIVLCLTWDHIAVIFGKLCSPGAFYCIEDQGKLRPIRLIESEAGVAIHPDDEAVRDRWVEAPPLVAEDALETIAWMRRSTRIPKYIQSKNGWEIDFVSSRGLPHQGFHYDFAWIDESIMSDEAFFEIVRGLVDFGYSDFRSRAIWTATPQAMNVRLWELRNTAESGGQDVAAFKLRIEDNPFIPQEERQLFLESLPRDERIVRYYGEHAMSVYAVYPGFSPEGCHGFEPFAIPSYWSHYIGLDPGRRSCATVIGAVDPEEAHLWIYDAFIDHDGDADSWAEKLKSRVPQELAAAVIDGRAGPAHNMGTGKSVAQFYWEALQRHRITVQRVGPLNGFFAGTSDCAARIQAVKESMVVRSTGPFSGTPRLRVSRGRCRELVRQIQQARVNPGNNDKRVRGDDDLLDALEYLVAFNPVYVGGSWQREPSSLEVPAQPLDVWEDFQRRRRRRRHVVHVSGVSVEW
ncbi:MAG: terminase family protein, partial [candidate division KSB1 bacterium]|nr:terminase family protein [candidate division KSB1 bacterium]